MRGELLRRYNRFRKAINLLEELSKKNFEDIVGDYLVLSSLERNIQVAVEFAIDLANYMLAESGVEIPDTYKDIISKVGKLCKIDQNLIEDIRGIVGLRNIIVHLYADINYSIILDELDDIIAALFTFVSELLKCIKDLGIDP